MAVESAPTCRECGGPKPRGRGRKLCDGCRVVAAAREKARTRDLQRRHYQRNREAIIARSKRYAERNAEKVAAYKRQHHAQNADLAREDKLIRKYGITAADYQQLLNAQGGGCAICGRQDQRRRLNVDHDHATGMVRGLLCSGCNGARLGRLGDSPERAEELAAYYEDRAYCLRAAADYLRNPPAIAVLGSDPS